VNAAADEVAPSGVVLSDPVEWSVDELARRAGLPVRTIREYQTLGLLPPPRRRGRVGIYATSHLARLELIGRLQARGYSLAGIRDLLGAWRDGADLGEVLGLAPDQLVHIDEPSVPATLDQLATVLPQLVPERLDELLATGTVEACGPDRYCVPSPSLLQLTADALAAGYAPGQVLAMLRTIGRAAAAVADATIGLLGDPPPDGDRDRLVALAERGRGFLAHGVGRLAVHTAGRQLGVTGEDSVATVLRRHLEAQARSAPLPPSDQRV
jgi:DNA-binding transcriptional MerR regulator